MFWYPYIQDDAAGSANYSFGSRKPRSAYCERCASAYRLLDLPAEPLKKRLSQRNGLLLNCLAPTD